MTNVIILALLRLACGWNLGDDYGDELYRRNLCAVWRQRGQQLYGEFDHADHGGDPGGQRLDDAVCHHRSRPKQRPKLYLLTMG